MQVHLMTLYASACVQVFLRIFRMSMVDLVVDSEDQHSAHAAVELIDP